MIWSLSWRADPRARVLADRHYNRQSPDSPQFVPPGADLVLYAPGALWVTSYQIHARHAWPGAWVCATFRREAGCAGLASEMIREAVAATRWRFASVPAAGMITFVDPKKVRHKRDPGRCFLRAGFVLAGETAGGHGRSPLLVFQMVPSSMPAAEAARGVQFELSRGAA